MIHRNIANALRRTERDLLIEHVDGSKDVPAQVYVGHNQSPRNSLILKGLVRPDRRKRATKTLITEDGRQVLAYILGEYADALIRAGYVGLASPIEPNRPRPLAVDDRELETAI